MDRLKMLLQIQDCQRGLTIQEGIRKMSAEGELPHCRCPCSCVKSELQLPGDVLRLANLADVVSTSLPHLLGVTAPFLPRPGTVHAFFKGNGTNVVKIAPETAIKLTLNDALKRVRAGGSDLLPCTGAAAAAAWGAGEPRWQRFTCQHRHGCRLWHQTPTKSRLRSA